MHRLTFQDFHYVVSTLQVYHEYIQNHECHEHDCFFRTPKIKPTPNTWDGARYVQYSTRTPPVQLQNNAPLLLRIKISAFASWKESSQ